ncbi:MAG: bifunctional 5,10-methylenetetrahydrofolate dehydrogenase/5,10-methenyltetrahydrofolate cyclohydrolase [Candidatus Paceibacterota bacterium]
MKINGKIKAEEIIARLNQQPTPEKLLVVFLDDNQQSFGFVQQKKQVAERLGVSFVIKRITSNHDQAAVKELVQQAAADKGTGGIVIQLPLDSRFQINQLINQIPPEKDLDVLSRLAVSRLYQEEPHVLPPAVGVVQAILKEMSFDIHDKHVAVVGAGALVGKPVATWFFGKAPEVSVLDKGSDLGLLKEADLVVSGTGQAGLVKPEMLKNGAGFIDFGYGQKNGRISGDLDTAHKAELEKLQFYTPTPEGTGPILIAKLFENFYQLNVDN